jgi:hypothetical protein
MAGDVCEERLAPDTTAQGALAMIESAWTSLHVELITEGFCMVGRLNLRGAQSRLADVLNFRDEPAIVLHDVEARRLGSESDKVFNCPMAHVRREVIILAIPHEDSLPAAEAQPSLEYVAKEPHRVSFLMPAFTIVGNLHLAKGVDINAASPMRGLDFVPLTDAEATYLPDPTLVWKGAVIVVNAAKAEAFSPAADLSP